MDGSTTRAVHIITVIPNSMIDDFFFFGFIAGIIGFLYYLWLERNDPTNHVSIFAGIYGTFLSGCVGGLLAIVFDRSIELSIIVGLLNQLIYMAMLKSAKSGKFWVVLKEILIKYLTAGKT